MIEVLFSLLTVLGAIFFCGFGGGFILSIYEQLKDWQ